MSQEITILVLVDVQAALEDNSLEGNIYLIDNLRTEGSENECSGDLISAINGTYWYDGSQANEIIINWLITGVSSLPQTLPRNYHQHVSSLIDKQTLHHIRRIHANKENKDAQGLHEAYHAVLSSAGHATHLKDESGRLNDTNMKLLNVFGELASLEDALGSGLSHMNPYIDDITGEAVDNEVIFPTQCGTPVMLKDGWYWCATADTSKIGTHRYTLHITLFKLTVTDGIPVWEPVKLSYESQLKVNNVPCKNGFTNGTEDFLPMV